MDKSLDNPNVVVLVESFVATEFMTTDCKGKRNGKELLLVIEAGAFSV
jgi:hypothetical protein